MPRPFEVAHARCYNGSTMRRIVFLWLLALAPLCARADEAAAWAALREGGAVAVLMRHGQAPGTGDPPGWRLDDCSTQRNLSDAGRADARAAGERLRGEGVHVTRVLSSPWCRCVDTARLLDVGPVRIEPTFSNAYMLPDRRESLAAGARTLLADWRGPGVLVVVTHGSNILALTGRHPASGEIVVVRTDGALREVGSITPARRP
jgi:phosphohistidine phosphatase SixA